MAPIDLLAQPDLTDQLNKDETGSVEEGRDRRSSSKMARCRLKKLSYRGWRWAIKPGNSREGSEVVSYSIKTRADVTPSHYFLDRCGDLCFVIFARACLSARALFPFPLQADCLSWRHWTIAQAIHYRSIMSTSSTNEFKSTETKW